MMRYRTIARTGLRVSELCLGAMTFGGATPPDESRRIFRQFVEVGGNFVGTAVNYATGMSEEIVGELIENERDRFVVASKYTAPLRDGDPNSGGNHRKSLRQALETTLRRLRSDYVDLYWVHVWDGTTALDELMRALDDAVASGKVLHVGISNAPAWTVARANTMAELRGWSRFAAIQVEYNLTERTSERELLPMANALELSVLAWGPLAGGVLTGKYNRPEPAPDGRLSPTDRRRTERNLVIARAVVEIAERVGSTPAQVAFAWLRSKTAPAVIPIIGARTAQQIGETLAGLALELPTEHLADLDAASAVSLGYPHDFLASLRRSGYARKARVEALDRPVLRG